MAPCGETFRLPRWSGLHWANFRGSQLEKNPFLFVILFCSCLMVILAALVSQISVIAEVNFELFLRHAVVLIILRVTPLIPLD